MRGRYAPSPTGPLHRGNAQTALLAWLQARLWGGAFVMRVEDLDEVRAQSEHAAGLLVDLAWLGLDWDEGPDVGGPCGPYTQSERTTIYDDALERLRAAGLAYPCACSRRDIREAAGAPHGPLPVYPGTCRGLSLEAVRQARPDRQAAWRFAVDAREVRVQDVLAGEVVQRLDEEVGDFVIKRSDGLFAYQLAVVVDDILMGVTDVVRGADLLDSTPRQIALFEALGAEPPRFWHVPLVLDEDGHRLSKRDGASSIAALREAGMAPEALVGELAFGAGLLVDLAEAEPMTPHALLERLDQETFRRALTTTTA